MRAVRYRRFDSAQIGKTSAAGLKLQVIEAIARGGVQGLTIERRGIGLVITIDLIDDGQMPDMLPV